MRYLSLTKPGIIFGNVVTACGGFFLASQQSFEFFLLIGTLVGLGLVIASGCVFNNVIDRDIDQLMERTRNRPCALNQVSPIIALLYGTALGALGILVLFYATNQLTVLMALVGWIFYVGVYTLWLKRRSVFATAIGGISGAMPPVVGYCAVTNHLDKGALAVFLILIFWQLPHTYAIALYRLQDYQNAKIPVLPVRMGVPFTKAAMLICIVLFAITAVLPTLWGYTGYLYLVVSLLLAFAWLTLAVSGIARRSTTEYWAKRMFALSILIIMALCILMLTRL